MKNGMAKRREFWEKNSKSILLWIFEKKYTTSEKAKKVNKKTIFSLSWNSLKMKKDERKETRNASFMFFIFPSMSKLKIENIADDNKSKII